MIDYTKPHIYKRQILETGKFYIGKHKGGDKYYKGSGKDYKIDLKKFKIFETKILEYVEDLLLLNEREIYWLEYYDASNNPLFYNKTNKSYGPVSQTLEWRQNQSERMLGKSTTQGKTWVVTDTSNMKGGNNTGKTWNWSVSSTKERNSNISKSLQNRDISSWKDKIYTEERNKKISHKVSKPILQYDLKENFIKEWESAIQVQKELGFNGSNIGNCCNGKLKKAYNFIWKFKN
jgi:hypothetical protein